MSSGRKRCTDYS